MNPVNQTAFSSSSGDGGSGFLSIAAPQLLPELQKLELSLALAIFIAIHSLRQKKRHGVPVWPLLGMLPSLLAAVVRGELYDWITAVLRRRSGTFTFEGPWFSNLKCVVTADPRNVEHILKTKFSNFPKGEYFRYTLRDLLGDGIFNADDEAWQRQRKTASIEFHSARFRRLTAESLEELVHSRLLPVLEASLDGGQTVDLQDVLLRLTFDNICTIAFGVDPGCLRPGLPEVPFARAFEEATEAATMRFLVPTAAWRAMRLLNVGSERRLRESIRGVDEFAYGVIRARKKELQLLDNDLRSRLFDILTVFMRLRDDHGKPFPDEFLRDVCVNFILAGRDTSSVALAWFFWLVDRNPAVEKKILKEIHRIISEREDPDGREPVVFRPEEVKRMEYLQAALSESLRLYPSVPVDHKEALEEEVLPDGTVVKKGGKVVYSIYTMGRMEAIWGADCKEFKPERWLREGRSFTPESAYRFSAFNGGPRLCLGKDFAYYQMKYVAASILHRYRVKVAAHSRPATPKLGLTMYIKNGLKVVLSRREEDDHLSKY